MKDRHHASVATQRVPSAEPSSHRQPSFADLLGDRRDIPAGNDAVCADAAYAPDVVSPLWPLTYGLYHEARARRTELLPAIVRPAWRAIREALANARVRMRQRHEARMTSAALRHLDDRTLRDLGFHRLEISSIAAELSRGGDLTRRGTLGAFAECP